MQSCRVNWETSLVSPLLKTVNAFIIHVYVSLLLLCGHGKYTYVYATGIEKLNSSYVHQELLANNRHSKTLAAKRTVLFELRDCHDRHIVLCLNWLYVVQYQAVYISYALTLVKRPEWLGRSFMLSSRFTPAKEAMNSNVSVAYSCVLQCMSYKHSKLTKYRWDDSVLGVTVYD